MNAAFAAVGLDWVYVALPVPRGQAVVAVAGARVMGLAGLSVTMPHKEAVIPALDGLTSVAAALGAVNCIVRAPHDDALLLGDNTDGVGFLRGLREDLDLDAAGIRCVLLGAGGAGRSVAHALGDAAARSVVVVNRDPSRGQHAAALAGPAGTFIPASDVDAVADAVADADLLVNATPLGMGGVDGSEPETSAALAVPADVLRTDLAVAELVYHPAVTPLMVRARERGARAVNGLSMLVHQAAVAFEHWTATAAPIEVMRSAARDASTG